MVRRLARYVFAVHSNPVEGREQEYNDWYSNRISTTCLLAPVSLPRVA